MEMKSILLMSLTSQVSDENRNKNKEFTTTYISLSACSSIGILPSAWCACLSILNSNIGNIVFSIHLFFCSVDCLLCAQSL